MIRCLLPLASLTVDASSRATAGHRACRKDVVNAQSVVPWKGERPIIPPRVVSAFRFVQAKRIDQAYRKKIAKLSSHIGVEKDAEPATTPRVALAERELS